MKFLINKKQIKRVRGFIIPLTLLVTLVILIVSSGISIILAKELYFSKISRESQIAYYAADNALMCTIMVDDQYINPVSGLGIFPYDGLLDANNYIQAVITSTNADRQEHGLSTITSDDIKCATSAIFKTSVSSFSATPFTRVNSLGTTENGQKSSFNMKMDLGDGTFRCASVMVNKTSMFRQIIARGFTSCEGGSKIERAVVDTTEIR